MSKLYLEIDAVELEDGSAHPFEYFKADLKEFMENFGWKVVSVNGDVEDEDEDS